MPEQNQHLFKNKRANENGNDIKIESYNMKSLKQSIEKILKTKGKVSNDTIKQLVKQLIEFEAKEIKLKTIVESEIGSMLQKLYEYAKKKENLYLLQIATKNIIERVKEIAYNELFEYDDKVKIFKEEENKTVIKIIEVPKKPLLKKGKDTIKRKQKEKSKKSSSKVASVIIIGERADQCITEDKEIRNEIYDENKVPIKNIEMAKTIREKLFKELQKVSFSLIYRLVI